MLACKANWVFVSLINVKLWGVAFASGLKSDTGSLCVVLNMSLVEKSLFPLMPKSFVINSLSPPCQTNRR